MITSKSNGLFKLAMSLDKKKYREQHGLFKIEGLRFVDAAADQGQLQTVLYSDRVLKMEGARDLIGKLQAKGLEVVEMDHKLITDLSDTTSPQGMIGLAKPPSPFAWEALKDMKRLLVLDRVQDPGNLGTIIRTADAGGIDGIILIKGTVDPFNAKVLRSTMGSVFSLPMQVAVETEDCLERLKEAGFEVMVTALEEAQVYDQVDLAKGAAVVIGNEGKGASAQFMDQADVRITIPMVGSAESLNAAVAASILIFEGARQARQ